MTKEDSTSLVNSDRYLPCLEMLMSILEQQGGSERLAKAEVLRKEMEENKASVEALYVAALKETRREGEERRHKAKKKKKKSSKRRGGKRVKKRQSKQGEETTGRGGVPHDAGKGGEEGAPFR